MEEEIELQISIARQQQRAMKAVSVVFNDNTYRITNQVRVDAFNNMDHGLIQQLIARMDNDVKEARKVLSQITKTAQVLRYSLEIAEEGQSKAILAFTLVTIVFLPLSFVASLFGMNTTDIRNTESD
jgi:Mg2+ and Co2+ transporter CorA